MTNTPIPVWLRDLLLRQVVCLMIALGVAAILWALMGHGPSALVTLTYSFLLGNSTALALERMRTPRSWPGTSWSWLGDLALVLAITPLTVSFATAVVFYLVPPEAVPPAPRDSFWVFLLTGWKFPAVANLIFGVGYLTYHRTRCRLETHNRQLQQTIETEMAERELEAAELKQALEIQRGLLPKEVPQLCGFAIAGAWEPAKIVGGDYYDVISLGKDKLAICIADVAGKGVSAALLMANVQAAVRAFASEQAPPSRVCSQINSVLCTNIAPGKFVTLFYGVLDACTRTLQFTNAGHPQPLLIRGTGKATHLENGGALLGVFPEWQYEDSSVDLLSGDLLLLFTDGITEAFTAQGEEFGEGRLLAAIADARNRSLDELQALVFSSVKSFCNSRMSDDATLVMVAVPAAAGEDLALARRHNRQVLEPTGARS